MTDHVIAPAHKLQSTFIKENPTSLKHGETKNKIFIHCKKIIDSWFCSNLDILEIKMGEIPNINIQEWLTHSINNINQHISLIYSILSKYLVQQKC